MEMDFNMPPQGMDMNNMYSDPMFNPIMQYEQTTSYYRCLCTQMDYKIKCKEYDILCTKTNSNDRKDREIR